MNTGRPSSTSHSKILSLYKCSYNCKKQQAFVNPVMTLQVPSKEKNFLSSAVTVCF